MKNLLSAALIFTSASYAASWTGTISDSACGPTHAKMLAEHKDMKTDKECALACVRGGGKYVLVSQGKVYALANQTMPELQTLAGQTVEVTGTMAGTTITATKITEKK